MRRKAGPFCRRGGGGVFGDSGWWGVVNKVS